MLLQALDPAYMLPLAPHAKCDVSQSAIEVQASDPSLFLEDPS